MDFWNIIHIYCCNGVRGSSSFLHTGCVYAHSSHGPHVPTFQMKKKKLVLVVVHICSVHGILEYTCSGFVVRAIGTRSKRTCVSPTEFVRDFLLKRERKKNRKKKRKIQKTPLQTPRPTLARSLRCQPIAMHLLQPAEGCHANFYITILASFFFFPSLFGGKIYIFFYHLHKLACCLVI